MKLARRSLFCILLAAPAFAGVGNISSPEIKPGILELEYKGERYGGADNAQEYEIEIDYGFGRNWKAGFDLEGSREDGSVEYDGFGFEAQYQFTDQKDGWWLSSALKGEYGFAKDSDDADEGEIKLLLARNDGKWRTVFNADIERETGANRDHGVEVGSALKTYYKATKWIGPGIEWHAEWGELDDAGFDGGQNEHYLGPIIAGTLAEWGDGDFIAYTAGYYWGITGASYPNAARLQLQYGIAF